MHEAEESTPSSRYDMQTEEAGNVRVVVRCLKEAARDSQGWVEVLEVKYVNPRIITAKLAVVSRFG